MRDRSAARLSLRSGQSLVAAAVITHVGAPNCRHDALRTLSMASDPLPVARAVRHLPRRRSGSGAPAVAASAARDSGRLRSRRDPPRSPGRGFTAADAPLVPAPLRTRPAAQPVDATRRPSAPRLNPRAARVGGAAGRRVLCWPAPAIAAYLPAAGTRLVPDPTIGADRAGGDGDRAAPSAASRGPCSDLRAAAVAPAGRRRRCARLAPFALGLLRRACPAGAGGRPHATLTALAGAVGDGRGGRHLRGAARACRLIAALARRRAASSRPSRSSAPAISPSGCSTRLQATCPDTIELVGVFDDRRRAGTSPTRGCAAWSRGTHDDLIELSRQREIDRVIVALPHSAEQRLVEVLRKLHQMPVEISLAPDMVGFNVAGRESGRVRRLAAARRLRPAAELWPEPGEERVRQDRRGAGADRRARRCCWRCAVAIKLDSKGPVLFRQNRYGFGDRVIRRLQVPHDEGRGGRSQRRAPVEPRRSAHHPGRRLPAALEPRRVAAAAQRAARRDVAGRAAPARGQHAGRSSGATRISCRTTRCAITSSRASPAGPRSTAITARSRPRKRCASASRYDLDYINNWSLWFDIRSPAAHASRSSSASATPIERARTQFADCDQPACGVES